MKRSIITSLFAIISALSISYGLFQKVKAEKDEAAKREKVIKLESEIRLAQEQRQSAEKLARANATEAVKQADRANKEAEMTKVAEAEAKRQQAIAQRNAEEAQRQQKLAEENATRATQQERIAKANAEKAIKAQALAETNFKRAKEEERKAQRERYLAIANAMAIKSKELNDKEQEGLLAQQAYNFNTQYDGYPYNNDIYNGLFSALKKYDHPLTKSLDGHTNAARALVTNVGSASIFSGGSDGKVIRWVLQNNIWTGTELVGARSDYQVYSMDVSPNGNLLAVGGLYAPNRDANYVELYDLKSSGSAPKKIAGYKAGIENINFTPEGDGFYALCNSGRSIMYCDLTTARNVISPTEKITSLDLSPDGSKLAGTGSSGNLYVWNIPNNYAPMVYNVLPEGNDILAVAVMPDNLSMVIGDQRGEIRIITNGLTRRILSGHTSAIEQIKFSNSGKFMATASKDKSIRLWNLEKLREQPLLIRDQEAVYSMVFTPDDSQIMAAGTNTADGNKNYKVSIIQAWPTKIQGMAGELCGLLTRNMKKEEWDTFVGEDLPYELTCVNLHANNK